MPLISCANCGKTSFAFARRTYVAHCSACGRLADETIRRGPEAFCSPRHAEEFAHEVAATRASSEAGR